ncbi:MAG: hypothetical protein M3Z75_04335 [Actinomycetota bacterium]|nr:hypothetical protein [Actinomycetota bacterium]
MAEDEEIAAVLAELAEQDAAVAEDARAALEWVAGEPGRAFITQERIQGFCWYELPVKWFVDLDEKLRVAAALARALDLLELPRYAAICRSGATREILCAYEVAITHGKAAFRRAAAASGIVPPDLPEFEWGAVMGLEEASARSSTADFLEVAVASGDLVPGRPGWKTRQKELVRAHLNVPQVGLLGQTLAQVILTERAETWVDGRRSETRRRILAAIANRLLQPAELPAATATDPLPPLRWLLGQLDGGVALTQTGNLSQKFVQESADRFGWDFSRPPRTEDELFDLHQLRHFAQDLGLARRSGRTLTLTAKGRRFLADPGRLWRAVAAGLLSGDQFAVFAGELFLALLLDADSVPDAQIKATVGQAVAEEGYRESRSGEPLDEHHIGWAVHETSNLCRALGLLAVGGDWRDRSSGFTGTGQATALAALRARATGPRTLPWS